MYIYGSYRKIKQGYHFFWTTRYIVEIPSLTMRVYLIRLAVVTSQTCQLVQNSKKI